MPAMSEGGPDMPGRGGPPRGAPPRAVAKATMPLAAVPVGQEVILTSVDGGRGLLHRLAEMGIRPGARFGVLSRGQPGPFIIAMKSMRLVLGQGMVRRMLVRPV